MEECLICRIAEFGHFLYHTFAAWLVSQIHVAGYVTMMLIQCIYWTLKRPPKVKTVLEQLNEIGVNSMPVITICSLFTGMVLVVQVGKQFASLSAENYIGGTVGLSLTRELAPLLAGVVIAGRNGSAMAAEIGTMKVTEQIDALLVLSTNPISYLVVPRVMACAVMLPVLTIFANIIGLLGGALVAITQVGITFALFSNSVVQKVTVDDFVSGIIKAFFFGILIGIIACYKGLTCEGGAEGVGRATTGSVVAIITSLLVVNYFLSCLFFTYQQSITQ